MFTNSYRADIDGLRAVAVLGVVLFHAGFEAFSGGFVGVDVFFVISGFLITRLIRAEMANGTFRFANFYSRRARRIFPALAVVVALTYLLGFLLFPPDLLARLSGATIYALTGVSNFYFWGEAGYFDLQAEVKPLLHTWSLGVEEQFYVVWPLLLLGLIKFLPRFAVLATMVALGGVSLYFAEQFLARDPSAVFFLMPFRAVEFLLGALAVWASDHTPRNRLWLEPILLLGLALIIVPMFLYDEGTPFPGLTALVPCLGTVLAIYAGQALYLGRILSFRPIVFIGLVSYSFYLIHWPAIVFYKYYTFDIIGPWEKVALVGASFVLAVLSYFLVEQPVRKGARRPNGFSPPAYGLACTIIAIAIILPAASSWAQNGWSWRITQEEPPGGLVFKTQVWKSKWNFGSEYEEIHVVDTGSTRADARRALFIGDSHATVLWGLADYLGRKYNITFTFFAAGACPPIFGTDKTFGIPEPGRWQTTCRGVLKQWETIATSKKFDLVVLAARWMWHYEPVEYGPYKVRRDYLAPADHPATDLQISRDTFKIYLERTVRRISAAGSKVVVFSQVPLLGRSIKDCGNVPGWLYTRENLGKRCFAIDKQTALKRLKFTDETIASLAKIDGVSVVLPSSYFCSYRGPACLAFWGRTSLYRDDSHLSDYGAIYLAKSWEQSKDFPLKDLPQSAAQSASKH